MDDSNSYRLALVVTFGFLPQNFGRWWEPMIGTFYECRLNGGNSQRWLGHPKPTCCNKIDLNFWHSEAVGMQKKNLPLPAVTNFFLHSEGWGRKDISIVPTGALKLAHTCPLSHL